MQSVGWARVTKSSPCPVCQRDHYCSISPAGDRAYCTRVESDTPGRDGAGWIHRLTPPKPEPILTPRPRKRLGTPPRPQSADGDQNKSAPVQQWHIRDWTGETQATHWRKNLPDGDKLLRWKSADGRWGLGGRDPATLPLYGTETLSDLPTGAAVIVAEGEKAADAIRQSMPAVGTVTGAPKSPSQESLRVLVGFEVYLWPDNDEVGQRQMRAVAASLIELGVPPRLITWTVAPPKGDAADYPDLDLAALEALMATAVPITADDVAEEPSSAPWNLTDMGNAERLIHRHGPDLRWCQAWKRWVVWGSELWNDQGDDQVQERAKETVRSIYDETTTGEVTKEKADLLWKHAQRSEAAARLSAMAQVARTAPRLAIQPDDLDRDPWLLNCANGTIDLRRGVLLPFTRENLMTKRSVALFDTTATCSTWLAFLDQIFGGNAEIIGFMQRAAGYCLSGSTAERVLFILFGTGRNGKSTWLEVLRHVLGDYASGTPASTIMSQKNKGIPNDIARLKGARFVSMSETNEASDIDEAFIKAAAGGDTVSARFLHAEFFDFIPQFKIWIATNHKPTIKGTDAAVWDRIRLVPFLIRIPDDQLDKRLREKLIAERDGILQWLIAGCLDWQRRGELAAPAVVLDATKEYQIAEDLLAGFFEDRCIEQPLVSESSGNLYGAYAAWAKAAGEEVLSQRRFGDKLRARGMASAKSNGVRIWRGIRLLAADRNGGQEDGLRD